MINAPSARPMLVVRPSIDVRMDGGRWLRWAPPVIFYGVIAFVMFESGPSRGGLFFLGFTGVFIAVVPVGCEFRDIKLRGRTRYIVGDDGLTVMRDENIRAHIPYEYIGDIRPDVVLADGTGSADLPKPNGAPYIAVWNNFVVWIPAMRPERRLHLVSAIREVCAELRGRADERRICD
ncbi:hypothetical protein [uncultured Sphingomonas sp.]|uniref:hypothetical protein n=1 Tax=uncultured Sphingomonas sp. TaxID=158754 RepID=UPI0035CB2DF7